MKAKISQCATAIYGAVPPHPLECERDPYIPHTDSHDCRTCGGCVSAGCAAQHPDCPINKPSEE